MLKKRYISLKFKLNFNMINVIDLRLYLQCYIFFNLISLASPDETWQSFCAKLYRQMNFLREFLTTFQLIRQLLTDDFNFAFGSKQERADWNLDTKTNYKFNQLFSF